jgi:hypothetical protein
MYTVIKTYCVCEISRHYLFLEQLTKLQPKIESCNLPTKSGILDILYYLPAMLDTNDYQFPDKQFQFFVNLAVDDICKSFSTWSCPGNESTCEDNESTCEDNELTCEESMELLG